MENYLFETSFSSEVKALLSEDFDFNLALASLDQIGQFVPDIKTDEQIDLLPIAFNACVANRVNRNGDVIDTETAIAIYKNFINKPINTEHNRDKIIGSILKAGFSEFGTDKPLTEEEVMKLDGPFNITLGGVLWKIVNPRIAKLVEDSCDPSDENYLSISASWELGFSNFDLILLNNDEKNISKAEIISDPEKVEEYKGFLRSFGGKGMIDDGRKIYRKIKGTVVPLGVGLTENPAADVKGIVTNIKNEDVENEQESLSSEEKNNLDISQINKNNVLINKRMNIQNISDITDESLKQVQASEITDFISQEIKKASEVFEVEKVKSDELIKASKEQNESLSTELSSLKAEYEKLSAVLAEIQKENEAKAKQELFNDRMNSFDVEFSLSDAEREIIASDILDMNEDAFAAYKNKMNVLLKKKNKQHEATESPEKESMEESAVKEKSKASVQEVVEAAVDNSSVNAEQIPNSATVSESLFDKYKKAFGQDGFEIRL